MSKILIVLITLVLLVSNAYAAGQDRIRYAEFDGEINFISRTGSKASQQVVSIQGEGKVIIDDFSALTSDTSRAEVGLRLESSPGTIRPLEAIVATRIANGPEPQIYATLIRPAPGTVGVFDQSIEVRLNMFSTFDIEAETTLEYGRYRNYINLYNESTGITLSEAINFLGQMYMLDMISLSIENDEEEVN